MNIGLSEPIIYKIQRKQCWPSTSCYLRDIACVRNTMWFWDYQFHYSTANIMRGTATEIDSCKQLQSRDI